eukprot:scaffold22592_cov129-Cylindrotheca_fusiformis.AAC.22
MERNRVLNVKQIRCTKRTHTEFISSWYVNTKHTSMGSLENYYVFVLFSNLVIDAASKEHKSEAQTSQERSDEFSKAEHWLPQKFAQVVLFVQIRFFVHVGRLPGLFKCRYPSNHVRFLCLIPFAKKKRSSKLTISSFASEGCTVIQSPQPTCNRGSEGRK